MDNIIPFRSEEITSILLTLSMAPRRSSRDRLGRSHKNAQVSSSSSRPINEAAGHGEPAVDKGKGKEPADVVMTGTHVTVIETSSDDDDPPAPTEAEKEADKLEHDMNRAAALFNRLSTAFTPSKEHVIILDGVVSHLYNGGISPLMTKTSDSASGIAGGSSQSRTIASVSGSGKAGGSLQSGTTTSDAATSVDTEAADLERHELERREEIRKGKQPIRVGDAQSRSTAPDSATSSDSESANSERRELERREGIKKGKRSRRIGDVQEEEPSKKKKVPFMDKNLIAKNRVKELKEQSMACSLTNKRLIRVISNFF